VKSSAFEAEKPNAGQGVGEVGPNHTNCVNNRTPATAGLAGIGSGASQAPIGLLNTVAVTSSTAGSIQASPPRTGSACSSAGSRQRGGRYSYTRSPTMIGAKEIEQIKLMTPGERIEMGLGLLRLAWAFWADLPKQEIQRRLDLAKRPWNPPPAPMEE